MHVSRVHRSLGTWAVVVAALAAVAGPRRVAGQIPVDQRRAATPDVSVRISGVFTSLRIIGWDRDTVAITGSVPKGSRFEVAWGAPGGQPARGAKMFLESPGEMDVVGGKLELRVPTRARVWAKSGSAEIDASGVTGGLDLNIIGGSVHVAGTPRELNLEAMDGSITVDASAEWLRAKTATGDIVVRGGSADAGLSTVSGTIRVVEGPFERGKFEAVTGSIVFAGDPVRGAALTFDTHSGPIEIRLPPKPNVELDVASITGTIENGLTKNRPVPGREGRGQELGLSVGSGTARLVVRSFRGNIALHHR
jgi:putative adhesin